MVHMKVTKDIQHKLKQLTSLTLSVVTAISMVLGSASLEVDAAELNNYTFDYEYSYNDNDGFEHWVVEGMDLYNTFGPITRRQFTYSYKSNENDPYSNVRAVSSDTVLGGGYTCVAINGNGKGVQLNAQVDGVAATLNKLIYVGGAVKDLNLRLPDYLHFVYCASRSESEEKIEGADYTIKHVTLTFSTTLNTEPTSTGYPITSISRSFNETWNDSSPCLWLNLEVPLLVNNLQNGAFKNNLKLKTVSFDGTIQNMGNESFYGCTALENLDLASLFSDPNMNTIPDRTFYMCSSLKNIFIPERILNIGSEAFYQCDQLDYIKLGDNIQTVGRNAFANCSNLKYIYITSNYSNDWSNIVLETEKNKLVSEKVTTPPIVATLNGTAQIGGHIFGPQELRIFNKVNMDADNTSVTRDGQPVALTEYEDSTYGYKTRAYRFAATEKGNYVVRAKDILGNSLQHSFVYDSDAVDTAKPEIKFDGKGNIKFGTDGKQDEIYLQSAKVTVTENDSYIASVTLDGKVINVGVDSKTAEFNVTDEGLHTVVAIDSFGNTIQRTFRIDKGLPTITGIKNGALTSNSVELEFEDDNSGIRSVTINGVEQSNKEYCRIVTSGDYTVVVTDNALNQTTVKFMIDSKAPVLKDVINNTSYNKDIPINIESLCGVKSIEVSVKYPYGGNDKFDVTQGSVLSQDGEYNVTIRDLLGKSSSYSFKIDKTAPIFTGVINGKVYKSEVEVLIDEYKLKSVVINGKSEGTFSKKTFKDDGAYVIVATDECGNSSSVSFMIDTENPEITGLKVVNDTAMGFDTGERLETNYKKKVTLKFSDKVKLAYVTVNGSNKGAISSMTFNEGFYTVKAVDSAGNSTTVKFTVDKTKPKVTGIKNNKNYKKKVKIKISDKVSGLKTVTIDDKKVSVKKFKKGYTYKKKGKHTLIATDKVGNKTKVKFRIK